jgi:uncharacterized metal-binding protein YceD (DUF177 family)
MAEGQIRVSALTETPQVFALASDDRWWEEARRVFGAEGGETPRYARWTLQLEAYRIGRRLLFRGDLDASLGLICSWCVEPIDYPIRERVELLLEPAQNPERIPAGGIEIDPEDSGLGSYGGEVLDFGPVILEILALAWPMQPRASEACPERCPLGRGSRTTAGEGARAGNRPFAGLADLLRKGAGAK